MRMPQPYYHYPEKITPQRNYGSPTKYLPSMQTFIIRIVKKTILWKMFENSEVIRLVSDES